jgi:hypothetical protein
MNDPISFHPDLTAERLRALAQVIVQARRRTLPLHDVAAGEINLSLGTRTRERACQAYRDLADEVDWLRYLEQGYYFLLLIGSSCLPVKFHRADPSDPPDRVRRALDAEVALKQAAFAFMADKPPAVIDNAVDRTWRLLFQDDPETHEVFAVTLARVGLSGSEERWEIDLNEPVSTAAPLAAELPEPAELDRPAVAPLPNPARDAQYLQ